MRKLFFTLCALLIGIAANSQTIYMMGAGDGLSWEAWPGKAINPNSDGSYSVTINNLTGFKMSTAEATGWDDFNAAAFGFSGSYGDAVYSAAGQTVNLEPWGENQDMPATGSYTLTINKERTSMTVKANFAKPTEAPAVYIRGGMNGWGSPDAYKFTYDSASDSYSWTGQINAGQDFKIADANWGSINYSTNGTITTFGTPINLTYNGGNSKFSEAFNGTIIFKITGTKTATASFNKEGEVKLPENMYVIGTIDGNAWDPSNVAMMTGNGKGVYTINSVTLKEYGGSTGFAITQGGADWNEVNGLRYGPSVQDSDAPIGTLITDIDTGDLSWHITPGTYKMVFDMTVPSLMITEVTTKPEPEPDPDPELGEEIDATFNFTDLNAIYAMNPEIPTAGTSPWEYASSANWYYLNGKELSVAGATLALSNGTATATSQTTKVAIRNAATSTTLRLPKGTELTVSVPEGYTIESIGFGGSSAGYVSYMALKEGQPGIVTKGTTSPYITTWTPTETDAAEEIKTVEFTSTGGGIIQNITVKAVKVKSEPEPEPEVSKVYVLGNGTDMTWTLPGTEYDVTDGVVTFTLTNVSKFKVSTVKVMPTGDEAWNEYNAGAYATGNTTFGNAVYPEGQTLPVEIWGEDQELPWTGDYTITLDLKNLQMTAKTTTPKPTTAPDVYIMGIGGVWEPRDTYKFTNVSWDSATSTGEYTLECTIPAASQFKIADANWGDVNYGGGFPVQFDEVNNLTYNGADLTMPLAFQGTVTFKITANKSAATVVFANEGEVKDPEKFYVVGTLSTGAWNPMVGVEMTGDGEGVYTAKEVVLVESEGYTGFTVTANLGESENDWAAINALRYGPAVNDTKAVIGENKGLATGDLSWTIDPGTYKMVFDYKNLTLTISEAESDGITGIETEEGAAEYFTLDGLKVKSPEKGLYIVRKGNKTMKVVR